jgi:putative transposase
MEGPARPGRPPIPADLQRLIVTMVRANPTWGEERIANELLLKLGLAVSPRTIGRYLRPVRPPRGGRPSQRWVTFVRNHATAVLACDFFTTVTAGFRVLYVFVPSWTLWMPQSASVRKNAPVCVDVTGSAAEM